MLFARGMRDKNRRTGHWKTCYNTIMKRAALKYFLDVIVFMAIIGFVMPACCCFAHCVGGPVAVSAVESGGIHRCCPESESKRFDFLKECVCRPMPRVVQFTQKIFDSSSEDGLYQGIVPQTVSGHEITLSSFVQNNKILTYKGPPIFILNCVYRC